MRKSIISSLTPTISPVAVSLVAMLCLSLSELAPMEPFHHNIIVSDAMNVLRRELSDCS